MRLRVSYKEKYEFFLHPSSHWRKEADLELDSDKDPLVSSYGSEDLDPDPHQKCHGSPNNAFKYGRSLQTWTDFFYLKKFKAGFDLK